MLECTSSLLPWRYLDDMQRSGGKSHVQTVGMCVCVCSRKQPPHPTPRQICIRIIVTAMSSNTSITMGGKAVLCHVCFIATTTAENVIHFEITLLY